MISKKISGFPICFSGFRILCRKQTDTSGSSGRLDNGKSDRTGSTGSGNTWTGRSSFDRSGNSSGYSNNCNFLKTLTLNSARKLAEKRGKPFLPVSNLSCFCREWLPLLQGIPPPRRWRHMYPPSRIYPLFLLFQTCSSSRALRFV